MALEGSKPLDQLTDHELVEMAQKDQVAAFDHLYKRYHAMVFQLAYRFTGNEEDSYDVVQETFIRVARTIDGFEFKSEFKTWLWRVATNCAHDLGRKKGRDYDKKREVKAQAEFTIQTADSPEALKEGGQISELVQKALSVLSAHQRMAFVLTVMDGLSHHEAAKAMRCNSNTVSWRVHSAKKKIKKFLVDEGALS